MEFEYPDELENFEPEPLPDGHETSPDIAFLNVVSHDVDIERT